MSTQKPEELLKQITELFDDYRKERFAEWGDNGELLSKVMLIVEGCKSYLKQEIHIYDPFVGYRNLVPLHAKRKAWLVQVTQKELAHGMEILEGDVFRIGADRTVLEGTADIGKVVNLVVKDESAMTGIRICQGQYGETLFATEKEAIEAARIGVRTLVSLAELERDQFDEKYPKDSGE